jgi:drug/metabolite transporter (DMT)-like permease
MNSYEIVFLRTLIGSALLVVIYLLKKGKFHITSDKKDYLFITLSGIAMGTSWMLLYEAYHQIGVGISSLLYYCGPVIVMILSPLIFKEKLTVPKIIGFLVVIVGIVLVNGQSAMSGINTIGFICGGMSAIMYFFMVTLNKQAKKITGLENATVQLAVSFFTTAVFVGIKEQFAFQIPASGIVWILILGILNTGIGCYLYFSPLSKLPAQTVAICGYLEPLSAVIFATLLLNEKMSVSQIAGAICIVGGAMIGELIKTKKQ